MNNSLPTQVEHSQHSLCVIASDHGGRFIGRTSKSGLDRHHIQPCHKKPDTPQRNGKIERFWRNIEDGRRRLCDPDRRPQIISEYNDWKHRALACKRVDATGNPVNRIQISGIMFCGERRRQNGFRFGFQGQTESRSPVWGWMVSECRGIRHYVIFLVICQDAGILHYS
jgi:hypothetical protein